jgi:hypothetical protein
VLGNSPDGFRDPDARGGQGLNNLSPCRAASAKQGLDTGPRRLSDADDTPADEPNRLGSSSGDRWRGQNRQQERHEPGFPDQAGRVPGLPAEPGQDTGAAGGLNPAVEPSHDPPDR